MARLVAGAATSHAFALREPETWDETRASNRQAYKRRFGVEPPEQAMVAQETDEDIKYRYGFIRRGHDLIMERFRQAKLQALVIIGDDQNENFTEQTFLPQLAIYTGAQFRTTQRGQAPDQGRLYQGNEALAEHLVASAIEAGFDVTACKTFPDGVLKAHAIGPVLERLTPEGDIPVVPVFVEGIHVPAPAPKRCFDFGRALAEAIESWPGDERVGVCSSGGISHFTAGYPYKDAPRAVYGNISVDFDRAQFELLAQGKSEEWASLTNLDLLEHGDVELRSWITLLGMVGSTRAEVLAYEPFYRGIMAMGVAYWDVEGALAGSRR